MRTASLHYRPDVDGLRAVAVLSVLAFHAAPVLCPGGFVGVDIFFVISGYLISSIILSGVRSSTFSFKSFYARRIRRIFPALIVVLVFLLLVGWLTFLIDEWERLGKHTLSAAAFIANITFKKELNYFDVGAEQKPLLHLWSLGVEEQYYIFWPLILWTSMRLRINPWITIFACGFYSFYSQVSLLALHKTSAAFYFTKYRAWELLLGATIANASLSEKSSVLACMLRRLQQSSVAHVASATGFALIIASLWKLNRTMVFPGVNALAPTVGAAFVLAAGGNGLCNRLLAMRPLVWFGLISYPLYLWHWPLLSVMHLLCPNNQVFLTSIPLVVAASVLLAWITYRWIEKPLRHSQSTAQLVAILIALAICGSVITRGVIEPLHATPEINRIVKAANNWIYPKPNAEFQGYPLRVIHGNSRKVVFIGDSTVEQYWPRIAKIVTTHKDRARSAVFITGGGCPPLPNVIVSSHLHCAEMMRSAASYTKDSAVDLVVIGASWNAYFTSNSYAYPEIGPLGQIPAAKDAALLALEHFLQTAKSAGKRVVLLYSTPAGPKFDPKTMLRRSWNGKISLEIPIVSRADVDADVAITHNLLTPLARRVSAQTIDPLLELCDLAHCQVVTPDHEPLYKDSSHLQAHYVLDNVKYLDRLILE